MKVDREQALDTALGQIERNFGKGAVMRMSDQAQVSVGAISTGSLALDLALGIGGLPRGRVVEIFGPESSGKTTLVYHVIAEAQRRGGICAFIDAEHAMDPAYAKNIGVNIDELLVSQPDTGEQALEITELLVRSGALVGGRDRLGRRAHPEGRDRGRDGRLARRPAGAADVAGAAEARRHAQPDRDDLHLHEPAAREDRRHVRLARDDARRSGAEVLCLGPPRHPPDRDAEGRRRGDRQPRAGEGGEEQGLAAVQAGRVRHHLRRGDPLGGHRPRRRRSSARSSRSRARTSASATSGSARAARTRPRSCGSTPTSSSTSWSRSRTRSRPGRSSRRASPGSSSRPRPRRSSSSRPCRSASSRPRQTAPPSPPRRPAPLAVRTVTALHPERRDRVRIELDGEPWRTVPAAAVAWAGLRVDAVLDRERARELRRALRRFAALDTATRALARRDRSRAELEGQLARRGIGAPEREAAVETMARHGYLDDDRFAAARSRSLAARGYGDEAIRYDLEAAASTGSGSRPPSRHSSPSASAPARSSPPPASRRGLSAHCSRRASRSRRSRRPPRSTTSSWPRPSRRGSTERAQAGVGGGSGCVWAKKLPISWVASTSVLVRPSRSLSNGPTGRPGQVWPACLKVQSVTSPGVPSP